MDVETPDDDLTPWGIPLDEPAAVATPTPVAPPEPVSYDPPAAPAPRLSLFSRDVPNIEFQPRLRTDR